MKHINKRVLIIMVSVVAVSMMASLVLVNSNESLAAGGLSTSVTETGKAPGSCVRIPGENTDRYLTYNVRATNTSNQAQQINTAVFHSNQSGCASYNGDLGAGWQILSGQTIYQTQQVGDLSLRYDTAAYTCGRTQYDVSYNVLGRGWFDDLATTYTNVFIGVVVDYGVDCQTPSGTVKVISNKPGSAFYLKHPGGQVIGDRVDSNGNKTYTGYEIGNYFMDSVEQFNGFNVSVSPSGSQTLTNGGVIVFTITYTTSIPTPTPTPSPTPTPTPQPVSVNIVANPTTIARGNSSVLSWNSSNADICIAVNGWFGVRPVSGTQVVSPVLTTVFRITCSNNFGFSDTDSVVILVIEPSPTPTPTPVLTPTPTPSPTPTPTPSPTPTPTPTPSPTPTTSPVSVSLISNPPIIKEGSSSILSWASSNATICVAQGDGWFGSREFSGNQTVSPNQTTIYRIFCSNSVGSSATAQTIVTVTRDSLVVSGPTVTLIANPSTIRRGETSILTWSSTNATSCAAQGDNWFGSRNISGNETVAPSQTTTFRMNCSGSGGTASTQTTVNVIDDGIGLPGVDITANPISINQGASSTLIWSSTNATSCFALNNWSGSKSISGSETVTPSFTATYTINCSNSRGSASDSVTVFVTSTPIITAQSFTVACVASPFVAKIGETVTFAAGQTGGTEPVSFVWSGLISGTGKVVRQPVSTPGIHTVFIIATDALGRIARGSCLADPLIKTVQSAANGFSKASVIQTPEKLSPQGKEFSSSTNSVELKWKSVKNAKGYNVRVDFSDSTLRDERNNCPNNPHYVCINGLTENKLSIEVEPGQRYSWWVHAIDSSGNLSEPASAWFSVKADKAGKGGNFFANIFDSAGKSALTLGLIILGFIFGYFFGKRKNKLQSPPLNL